MRMASDSPSPSESESLLSRPPPRRWRPDGGRDIRWMLRVLLRTALMTAAAFLLFGGAAVGLGDRAATWAVQLTVLVLVWLRIGRSLRSPRQWIVVRGIRPRHFLIASIILPCTLAAVVLLLAGDTFLRWGWWSALGGEGNVIFGQARPSGEMVSDLILPLLILTPLLLSLGRFALQEERIFRLGDERRGLGERLLRSLVFGLAHLVMGIPIGAAIGLGVGGFGFSQVYLRRWHGSGSRYRSVLDAARVHLAYNLLIIGAAGAMLIATLAARP
jgi:hypothetical protein